MLLINIKIDAFVWLLRRLRQNISSQFIMLSSNPQATLTSGTTGQVVEYHPARVETRVRFPGDTFAFMGSFARLCRVESPSGSD